MTGGIFLSDAFGRVRMGVIGLDGFTDDCDWLVELFCDVGAAVDGRGGRVTA